MIAESRIPIGWINYWNLWPMRTEINRSPIAQSGRILFFDGHPVQVNKGLVDGSLALAPSSSICLLKHNSLNLALPVGVASTGPVMSVYLGFPEIRENDYDIWHERASALGELFRQVCSARTIDPRRSAAELISIIDGLLGSSDLPGYRAKHGGEVRLTPASAASVAMTKVIHRLLFGTALTTVSAGDATIDLLIGDEALKKRDKYAKILDLGEIWNRLTGLPFVFAVWQFGAGVSAVDASAMRPVLTIIKDAAERAQAKMKVSAADYKALLANSPLEQGAELVDLARYWRVIEYSLTPQHLRGLILYLGLARATGAVVLDDDDKAVRRLMRLFQQCEDASGREITLS